MVTASGVGGCICPVREEKWSLLSTSVATCELWVSFASLTYGWLPNTVQTLDCRAEQLSVNTVMN